MAWVPTGLVSGSLTELASGLGSTSLTALELASESRSCSAWVSLTVSAPGLPTVWAREPVSPTVSVLALALAWARGSELV